MPKTSVTSCLPTTTSYSVDKSLTQHTLEAKNCTNLRCQVSRSEDDEREIDKASKLSSN